MSKQSILRRTLRLIPIVTIVSSGLAAVQAATPFLPNAINTTTMPTNGDVNPYGVAFVPDGFPTDGAIKPGDVLIANFNNSGNLQGTGTTITQFRPTPNQRVAPPGTANVFFTSKLPGLDTALGAVRGGFVFVGNVPTTDGTFKTIGQGALQVIDRNGNWVASWTDPVLLDGPWDLAIDDQGSLVHIFVSNVLNGTVVRLDVSVSNSQVKLLNKTLIGNGYTHRPNGAALVLGPTGLAFDGNTGTLYVASTADNAIYAIDNAAAATMPVDRGALVFADNHLRGPLALRLATNGDLITANGDAVNHAAAFPSELVEFTEAGAFVRQFDVDSSQGGSFGLDILLNSSAPYNFAYIDDVTNNLTVTEVVLP